MYVCHCVTNEYTVYIDSKNIFISCIFVHACGIHLSVLVVILASDQLHMCYSVTYLCANLILIRSP